ncbi:MAG: DUF2283 domain-containing protein [Coriobacteriia bacterium]
MKPRVRSPITIRSHEASKERVLSRDLDENTVVDVDDAGSICAITVEHASTRAGAPQFSFEQVAA